MKIFEEKTSALESIFINNESIRNSILLANRYYLNYHITDSKRYLIMALDTLILCFNKNHSNLSLYLLIIFFYAENGELEKAEHYYQNIYPSRNYFKNNEPENYMACMFLRAFIDIKKGSDRNLKKFRKLFANEMNQELSARSYFFLGLLELLTTNYDDCFKAFLSSYRKNNSQLFLNIFILKYFYASKEIFDKEVFYNNLNWALSQGFDIKDLLTYFENYIIENPQDDIAFYKKIYSNYQPLFILKIICKKIYDSRDYSFEALNYYNQAEQKLVLDALYYDRYIELAYKYEQESISSYIIVDYIKNTRIDNNIRAFLYYNLIKDPKLIDIMNNHKSNIMQFAAIGIENNVNTKYFKNIYAYFLVNSKNYSIGENILKSAEKLIKDDIFKYEIHLDSDLVSHIWVCDKLKKDIESYHVKSKKIDIFSSTESFNIFCFDRSIKKIINDNIKITKVLNYSNIELLKYFYSHGNRDVNLLLAYSDYYVSNKNVLVEGLHVLKDTLECTNISDEIRTNINAQIGNIYNINNRYQDALSYYLKIDYLNVPDRHVESMLLVFLNSEEIDLSVKLLLSRNENISDKNIFFAIKEISRLKDYNEQFANLAYDLLIKNWYDKILIDIVLSHYKGSLENWLELSKSLSNFVDDVLKIDEIILEMSLYTKIINQDIQKSFCRVYEAGFNLSLIEKFIYFIMYKICNGNYDLDYETIGILEKEYKSTGNKMICYMLSSVYIANGINFKRNIEIMKDAEQFMLEDEILFPIFKKIKDKTIMSSYIEKNQPFVYKTYPSRKVFIFYKFNEKEDFQRKQMKYFKFGYYFTNLICFFGEKITYFISEELDSGSIETKEETVENFKIIVSDNFDDKYFTINQALIWEKTLKFSDIFTIISDEMKESKKIKGRLV